MKNKFFKSIAAGLVVSSAIVACGEKAEFPGFTKLEDGLYIKYENRVEGSREAQKGDILTMSLKYGTKDSTLMNTADNGAPFRLQLDTAAFVGDIMNGFRTLRVGDSAVIITRAYDFFTKTVGAPMPEFIDSAEVLYFTVKLNEVESEEEARQKAEAGNAQKALKEQEALASYIESNQITTEPTASGLYFISEKKGTGKAAEAGKTVKVHYTGMFLDGTKFDSSVDRGEPFEFQLGVGNVIRGWDEGVAMMKEGGKAKLLIPSSLAYGPQDNGPIPGFSTLMFEVELIEVDD